MSSKGVGVLAGARLSFLDHLAPLCDLLEIPLFCTDRWLAEQGEIYYPQGTFLHETSLSLHSYLVYVEPSRLHHGHFDFGGSVLQEKKTSICGLHGFSEKNFDTFWYERLADEQILLIYGPYLLAQLKAKGILARTRSIVMCGNYREKFYRRHQLFFDRMADSFLFPPSKRKTILYAPTWCYQDRRALWNSSFFEVYEKIFENVPDDFQVLVKLHPFYFQLFPQKIEMIQTRYASHENLRFIPDSPLVYPLLEKTDIYLGDYSSVGYDFLFYNRPLFFLTQRDDFFLQKCGRKVSFQEGKDLFSFIREDPQLDLRQTREDLYLSIFDPSVSLTSLKEEIQTRIETVL